MAKLRVQWTKTAKQQRDHIFKYWNKRTHSTEYSKKLKGQIKQRLEVLKVNPEASIDADFPNTLFAAMGHFSIFYQIKDNSIIITAFWDNRNDPDKLLGLLKN